MDGYITIGTKIDTSGLEEGIAKIEGKLDQGLDRIERKVEQSAEKSGKKFGTKFMLGFSLLNSVVSRIVNKFASSLDSAISRVDTLNNFPRVMKSLGQNTDDATQSVNYLSDKLTGLPTTLDSAVSAVQRFTSANNNVKASTEIFLALNNAVLAGGTPMQQQQLALEQLSQAYAKGKPDMMEWRSAMSVMPAQLNQAAQAMGYGKNGATKLGEALRKGDVSMNEFMTTLVKMNKQGMNGFKSLEEQAREGTGGIQTSLANLKTAFTRAMAEILQTIGQTNITRFFQTIIDAIKAVIPYIGAFVKSLMVAITALGNVIKSISNGISSLFGKNTAKNAKEINDSTKDMGNSMNNLSSATGTTSDNLGSANKKAKELKKQLTGFDEMNILQDTTSSTSGAAAGDVSVGGLEGLQDIGDLGIGNIGDSIKKVTPLMEAFVSLVWGLIAAFGAFKIMNLLKSLGLLSLSIGEILSIAAGIGSIVGGIVLIVQGIIDYLKDPTWGNFAKILAGIALVGVGVALIFGGIPALITAAILLVAAIGVAIYKNWDKIKAVLSKVGQWIYDHVIKPVIDFFKALWEGIKAIFKPVIQFYINIYKTIFENLKIVVSNMIKVVVALWNGIKSILSPVFKWVYDHVIKPVADFFGGLWKSVKDGASTAWKGIKNIFRNVAAWFKQNVIDKIVSKLRDFGKKVGDVVGGAFKGAINFVLSAIESILNTPIRAINGLIDIINKIPGISLGKLNTFSLPRLAKGGIVNMPGPGVMVGSAMAGERGAEGVIPLTDSQQMDLLGAAIGKHITINATIPVYAYNKQVDRQMKKIKAENDFAFNR